MKIFAIDPGSEKSSFVIWDPARDIILEHGLDVGNGILIQRVRTLEEQMHLVIERIASQGMIVGQETFDTADYVGALGEAYVHKYLVHKIFRRTIRIWCCGSPTAGDSNIRRFVIDRYHGEAQAIGGKKCPKCKGKGWFGSGRKECPVCKGAKWRYPPGKLFGIAADEWQAMALAIYFFENLLFGREKKGGEPNE